MPETSLSLVEEGRGSFPSWQKEKLRLREGHMWDGAEEAQVSSLLPRAVVQREGHEAGLYVTAMPSSTRILDSSCGP